MTVSLMNSNELPTVPFFRQVSVATGSTLVFMAGQVAWTADGSLVGEGDLAAQVEQCFLNVGAALARAGACFDNVVKLTTFVTDWSAEKMELISEGRARACAKLGVTVLAPSTLIGVAALYSADLLVEVEAIAVID